MADHLSLLDMLLKFRSFTHLMFRLFTHLTWVSKVETSVPFIGRSMRLNGDISLRRGSVRAMREACERELRGGTSVMIFPEGTRSRTGELRPFRTGAFELALRTGCPVLPVVFEGTADALPERGVLQGRHRIRLTVLDPLAVEPGATPAERAGQAHAVVSQQLAAAA